MFRRIATVLVVVISVSSLCGCWMFDIKGQIRRVENELGETVGAENFERELFYQGIPLQGIQIGQFGLIRL